MAQRYVNTASTPGGDGTTNGTVGATRAYASLSEWEAARQGVLSEIETVDCEGSTADTTSCTIDGSTTTASFYHRIRAATGHEAMMPWSTSRYRLSVNGNVLLMQDDHVRVERVQAETIDTSSNRTVFYMPNANIKCIKTFVRYGTSNQHVGYDFRNGGIAENCVCIGNGVAAALGFTSSSGSGTMTWYNCTAIGCGINFDFQGTTTVLKNCLGHGATADATSDYVGSFGAGSTNNASEDATAGGANARASQTFTFVNAAGGDYNLASGDAGAKDFGADLSGDATWPFSDDFNGVARPQGSAWDIGASEVAAAAAAGPPPFARHRFQHMLIR